ncbi:MAG: nucleotidyltransferase [Deltaproteobacteria bacterium]|nr:nucleotidyltransferase [Deltaproteobacteria bacterium]
MEDAGSAGALLWAEEEAPGMTIFEAAAEVAAFLDEQGVPYAFLGGLVVQHWGEPRATQDVDVVVVVPSEHEQAFLKVAAERFQPRLPNAIAFARRHRMLLLAASDGTPVDISLGIPGYEEEVMRRAVSVSFGELRPIRIVTAEDLIVHKCVAGRARDIEDVERILVRQHLALDLRYIRKWLRAFAPIVREHDVGAVFENPLKKARTALRKRRKK